MSLRSRLIVLLLAGMLGGLLVTSQRGTIPEDSPLVRTNEGSYQDGSKLQSDYELFSRKFKIQAVASLREPTSQDITKVVEEFAQSKLPHVKPPAQLPSKQLSIRVRSVVKVGNRRNSGIPPKWFVRFDLRYDDVPLSQGSDLLAIVGTDGEVFSLQKRNLPSEVDATKPTIDQAKAITVGKDHFKEDAKVSLFSVIETSPPTLEIWVDPEKREGRLAWTFTAHSESWIEHAYSWSWIEHWRGRAKSVKNPHARRYWVSAVGEAKVLNRETLVYHLHEGTVKGNGWETSSRKPTKIYSLWNLWVSDEQNNTDVTNSNGFYRIANGTGRTTITASTSGPDIFVEHTINAGTSSASVSQSNSGDGTRPIDIQFGASTEEELASVTAFYWINEIRKLVKDSLGDKFLNQQLVALINNDKTCDADAWGQQAMTFYKAGQGCPNTAYVDIIAHEFGHIVLNTIGGVFDPSYSEGFGDALSTLVTHQPCLGRDFYDTAPDCIRKMTWKVKWPPESTVRADIGCQRCIVSNSPKLIDPHCRGLVYGGFVWELIHELEIDPDVDDAYATATELILVAATPAPDNIPQAVCLSFLADAKGRDPTKGPHFAQLKAAAESRNIPYQQDPRCAPPKRSTK